MLLLGSAPPPISDVGSLQNADDGESAVGDLCEGLWMPAGGGVGVVPAAGVRKPPGNERAGRRTSAWW
jgi:hypothetical protein